MPTVPKRLSVKFFVVGQLPFDAAELVPVFQRWIQQHIVAGLLIDVVDYKHVPAGPGVILIGDATDIALDFREGRPGLLITQKRVAGDSLATALETVLDYAQDVARKLESDPALKGLRVDPAEVEIALIDRLNTPNTAETFSAVQAGLQAALTRWYAPSAVEIAPVGTDPRRPLTVRAVSQPVPVAN